MPDEKNIPQRPIAPPNQRIMPRPQLVNEDEEVEEDNKKKKKQREPLSNQSKGILYGLLGGFCLLGGIALLLTMIIL